MSSRRDFLKVVGAVGAAVGCTGSDAVGRLVPYLDPPIEAVPGTPLFYRTLCRECPAGCGVTARSREGRVIKLEGSPDDPVSGGALCARGQAALQGLYAPDRFKSPMIRDAQGTLAPASWDDALAKVAEAMKGRAARMLARPDPGTGAQIAKTLPITRVVVDPLDPAALREANGLLFNRAELPSFDLAQARLVVSFGADFLESWLSPVALTRAFANGRGKAGEERIRSVWIGPRLSATGAASDRWLSVAPGSEATVALGLLRRLIERQPNPAFQPLLPRLSAFDPAAVEKASGLPAADLERLASELLARRPSALLGPGLGSNGPAARDLGLAVQLINALLGNLGKTVLFGLDPLLDPPSPATEVATLLADLSAGKVEVLLAACDPSSLLSGSWGAALSKARFLASFASRPDATTEHAQVVLPSSHALESFGDASSRKGVTTLGQPAMNPLGDTRPPAQILLDLGAKLGLAGGDLADRIDARLFAGTAEAVKRALRQKGVKQEPAAPIAPILRLDRLPDFTAPSTGSPLALHLFPTSLRAEGSGRTEGWLAEVGDPMSTVAWSAWAEVSPVTAEKLGFSDDVRVRVSTLAGSAELPLVVTRGIRPGVIAVPTGVEAIALGSGQGTAVTITSAPRVAATARISVVAGPEEADSPSILRTFAGEQLVPLPGKKKVPLLEGPNHPVHRWGMTIDLDRCVGCDACTVACYAENNIPVLGPKRISEGRSMAWIRIERWWGDSEGEPRADFLPMLCQQCGNAPCETVCPVYATYHTGEGLNAQIYNRCVGTRYCANNCPYKVRSFNYLDAEFPSALILNPEVTVRTKGVMEKCTFCVQRIRAGEWAAKREGRPVEDGEIVPACAQTCPAEAITFGDLDDPKSRVSLAARERRGYKVMEELNTLPAVTYLARVTEGRKG